MKSLANAKIQNPRTSKAKQREEEKKENNVNISGHYILHEIPKGSTWRLLGSKKIVVLAPILSENFQYKKQNGRNI